MEGQLADPHHGIAALEAKIVQQAVVTILNEIYEVDFRAFRLGSGPDETRIRRGC